MNSAGTSFDRIARLPSAPKHTPSGTFVTPWRPKPLVAHIVARMAFLAFPALTLAAIDAQYASQPSGAATRFEVASIKPAPPLAPELRASGARMGVRLDKAQAAFGGMSLSSLISYAYGVMLAWISGPDWLAT